MKVWISDPFSIGKMWTEEKNAEKIDWEFFSYDLFENFESKPKKIIKIKDVQQEKDLVFAIYLKNQITKFQAVFSAENWDPYAHFEYRTKPVQLKMKEIFSKQNRVSTIVYCIELAFCFELP